MGSGVHAPSSFSSFFYPLTSSATLFFLGTTSFQGRCNCQSPLNVAKKPKIDYCSKYQPYSKENGMATIWTMTLIYIVLVSRKRLPTTVIPQDRWPGYS